MLFLESLSFLYNKWSFKVRVLKHLVVIAFHWLWAKHESLTLILRKSFPKGRKASSGMEKQKCQPDYIKAQNKTEKKSKICHFFSPKNAI